MNKPISEIIRQRIVDAGAEFLCNDNISDYITDEELMLLQNEVAAKLKEVFKSLVIDVEKDHNMRDSALRVAKMWCHETFSGRYYKKPSVTEFPNVAGYDSLYVTGPITIRSVCSHHLQPITGQAWVGILPSNEVIGLSKFGRLADWIASRPTIQEEMSQEIANLVEEETKALGVALLIKAEHGCMTNRGVKEHQNDMVTAVMRGAFKTDASLKQEFYNILNLKDRS